MKFLGKRLGVGTYGLFESTYAAENYVKIVMQRTHRSTFAIFRLGIAPLSIETERYERLEVDNRVFVLIAGIKKNPRNMFC